MCLCVFVCVCVCLCIFVRVCACVCVRERDRERFIGSTKYLEHADVVQEAYQCHHHRATVQGYFRKNTVRELFRTRLCTYVLASYLSHFFQQLQKRKEPGSIKLLPEIWGLLPSECVVNLAVSVVYISGGKNPRERASVPGYSILCVHMYLKPSKAAHALCLRVSRIE